MPLTVFDIPSKCRFDLIQVTLEQVRDGRSADYLAKVIHQHIRHAHFLLENAYILGFISREGKKPMLTPSGSKFLEASKEKKGLMLAKAMLESRVMKFIIKRAGSFGKATKSFYPADIKYLDGNNGGPSREQGKNRKNNGR